MAPDFFGEYFAGCIFLPIFFCEFVGRLIISFAFHSQKAHAMSNTDSEKTVKRICPLCEACCGLQVTIRDHQIIRIRGDDDDVFSHGYICPKGAALKDLHEDPDRLRTPLIKRDGKFVVASWDEAFAEIERRLPAVRNAGGNDAVATVIGNPAAHKIGLLLYFPRLARALGTRNVFSSSTLDQMPKQLSAGLMFGSWLSIPVPDLERSDFMLILGANPMVSNGSLWTVPDFRGKAKAMRLRGGRIVTVDPRRTETAAVSDVHHFIQPGTDVFFLLGMVHTLFAEQLINLGGLAEHVEGLAEVQAAVQAFAPELVAARCRIEAHTIRQLARQLAVAKRGVVYARIGTCTQEFGTQCSWLVDVLNILTGHLDREGGAMFPKACAFAANTVGTPGVGRGVPVGRHHSRVARAPEIMGELPLTCLAEEIEIPGEGQVRALITIASNPVLSAPNGDRLAAALEQLDFMLSIDIYLNETTRHADVILPGLSPLEDVHFDLAFGQFSYRNHARFSDAVLPRQPAHPPEWQILLRLAAIVQGKGALIDIEEADRQLFSAEVHKNCGPHADAVLQLLAGWSGPEKQIDFALRSGPYGDQFGLQPQGINLAKIKAATGGLDLGPLQTRIPEVLRTPSGKIELAPALLIADVARAAQALAAAAPKLVIIGRRQIRSGNSWMHNLPSLAKGPYRCTALIHPFDMDRLGLTDGGLGRITSGIKSIEVQIEMSEEMMPGVVSLPHGWGHDMPDTQMAVAAQRPGANLNALLDEQGRDPLSGNAVLSGIAVDIYPL